MKRKYFLLLMVCCTLLPRTQLAAQEPSSLSKAEKLYGLAHIWSEAKYNFVYFNQLRLNWDSLYQATIPQVLATEDNRSYYDVLRRFTAHLGDGHSSVWFPASFYKNEFAYAPLGTALIEDKVFITSVPDSLAAAGWQKGMELLKIDGMNVHAYAQQHVAPYEGANTPQGHHLLVYKLYLLNGPLHQPLALTVKDNRGRLHEKTLWRGILRPEPPTLEYGVLPGNTGLLTINNFSDKRFFNVFDSIYKEILQSDALIIDLRENTGGSGDQGTYLLKHLVSTPLPEPQISALQYNPLIKVWGQTTPAYYTLAAGTIPPFTNKTIYAKNVVLLMGKHTVSAAEDMAMQFDYMGRGPLVGQPTAGSTGQPMMSSLPGGGTFRVCVRKDTYPDGKTFVGKGIQPTHAVMENAEAYRRGTDIVLEKALKLVKRAEVLKR